MRISVFGLGYVGAVTMACLAELGHRLIGIDVERSKVDALSHGEALISEPGLAELLKRASQNDLIHPTMDVAVAVEQSDVAIICVGTPSTESGGIDDSYLLSVIGQICRVLKTSQQPRSYSIIVRSTCLPDVHKRLRDVTRLQFEQSANMKLNYVCHPEFLREGTAIADFFAPPKIVFGVESVEATSVCQELYPRIEAPTFFVPIDVASMIKYADNCFHAAKVTFANEIGIVCNSLSVDAKQVMEVFCQDTKLNISAKYLRPGAPFGGSCLPKDLRAMLDFSRRMAISAPMLSGIAKSNSYQIDAIVSKILATGKRNIGIVGLTFKENTDDLRESPAVAIAERLLGKGLTLRIHDAYLSVDKLIGANRSFALQSIPHLSSLLLHELGDVFSNSEIVLMFHRIDPEDLPIQHDEFTKTRVIDFSENNFIGSEGIYW